MEHAFAEALVSLPFGKLLLRAADDVLLEVEFMPAQKKDIAPTTPFLREAVRQMDAYAADPSFHFDLPYALSGTEHQRNVWQAIADIGCGKVRSYSDIAQEIGSSPRAVGTACGRNPLPVVIPCHRVVAVNGLGGFNANRNGLDWLPIKRNLLRHEGVWRENWR